MKGMKPMMDPMGGGMAPPMGGLNALPPMPKKGKGKAKPKAKAKKRSAK
jgi:hypothetical protein